MRAGARLLGFALLLALFWGLVLGHAAPRPTTGLSRDLYAYFFPRYVYSAGAMWRGELPLWNPYELCGVPLLAGAQGGALNPLVLAVFGAVPAGLALHVFFLLHFLLAGLLAYRLGRGLGFDADGAAVTAAAWTFSPALTHSIYHPNRIACLVWLPAVFWLGARLRREPSLAAAALLALALGLQATAGYPEFALDSALLLGLGLLAGLGRGEGRESRAGGARVAALVALAGGLAVLVAAAQLLPTLELVGASARGEAAAMPRLVPGPEVLRTLFGLRSDVGIAYMSLIPAFHVGAVTLLLAAVGTLCGRPGNRLPWLAGAAACVLAVIGFRALHLLPVYRSTRFPLPWALLFPFFTAVLAGAGWQALASGAATTRRALVVGLLILGVLLFGLLGTRLAAGFALLAAVLLLTTLVLRRRGGWVVAAALPALVAGELLAGFPVRQGLDPLPPLPRTATTTALLARLRAHDEPVRALGPVESYGGVALLERVQSIAGLEDSLMPRPLRRLVDHFGLAIGVADMPLHLEQVAASKPLLDLMGVAYVTGPERWASALADAGLVMRIPPAGGAHGLWENPGRLPRAFLVRRARVEARADEAFRLVSASTFRPRDEAIVAESLPQPLDGQPLQPGEGARVSAYAAERVAIRVQARAPALLVVTDADFPGWEARIDGARAPLVRTDFAFRGVPVPPGAHEVVLAYRPWSVRAGLALSALGLTLVAAAVARARGHRAGPKAEQVAGYERVD